MVLNFIHSITIALMLLASASFNSVLAEGATITPSLDSPKSYLTTTNYFGVDYNYAANLIAE